VSGGVAIYNPVGTREYWGDTNDFTPGFIGYVDQYNDDDHWTSGAYSTIYNPSDGSYTERYSDATNVRFKIAFVTEDYRAVYVDNVLADTLQKLLLELLLSITTCPQLIQIIQPNMRILINLLVVMSILFGVFWLLINLKKYNVKKLKL
jgi:hypothetical protein